MARHTTTPTPATPLQTFLHGDRLAKLAELDALLRAPEFAATSPATNTERNLRTYARLAAVGRHEGGSLALAADTSRLNAVQEWMAVVDPCLFHAALVHFAVCTWTIRALGRPDAYLAELTDELDRQHAAGSILITEVGRGSSHIDIATEARFDPRSRTFGVHTPDDGAAKIMANVAEPGVPKSAIVFAELVAGERRCGVFPFAMRIQTERGPAQGVRVAALSDVPAVPLDYALVRFEDACVPFDGWLCDSASIDPDGAFQDPLGRAERHVRSLAFGAHAALGAAVGLAAAARASVVVALRHSARRITSGTLAPGMVVLGYSTQQWALYGALADACATSFLVDDAKTWFAQGPPGQARPAGPTFAPWSAVNRGLALSKAAAAACLARVAATCRIATGAQGVLSANRITQYEGLSQSFQAAAGDSLLSRLDAGKGLVQDERYEVDVTARSTAALDFDAPATALTLSSAREAALLADLRRRVQAAPAGAAPFETWNPLLPATIELADAHLRNLTLRSFDERVGSAAAPEVVESLRPLQVLHGLNIVHEDLAWHLEHGSLAPDDLARLRAARERALARVHDHAAALVDGFAIPAERLQATIAGDDYVSAVLRELDAS